jgi:hypothetical protein
MNALGDDVAPRVHIVEGPDFGASLVLAEVGRVYVVGRGEECALLLADPDASREHMQIVRRGHNILVRDLGSKNGVLLGDSPLPRERDVAWRGATMLRIGASVMALDEPVARALGELEELEDEPIADEGAAARPEAESGSAPSKGPTSTPRAAPVAARDVTVRTRRRAPKRSRMWTAADLAVMAAAVGVIALSIAGLVWLLRG